MPYKILPVSTDVLRHFCITCGLRQGYTATDRSFTYHQAVSFIHDWMKRRCERDLPYLTGVSTNCEIIYTWKGATRNQDSPEPGIQFSGDVSVVYNADMSDDQVVEILKELAAHLGETFYQTRVYVAYRDKTWIMEAEGKTSPRAQTKS